MDIMHSRRGHRALAAEALARVVKQQMRTLTPRPRTMGSDDDCDAAKYASVCDSSLFDGPIADPL